MCKCDECGLLAFLQTRVALCESVAAPIAGGGAHESRTVNRRRVGDLDASASVTGATGATGAGGGGGGGGGVGGAAGFPVHVSCMAISGGAMATAAGELSHGRVYDRSRSSYVFLLKQASLLCVGNAKGAGSAVECAVLVEPLRPLRVVLEHISHKKYQETAVLSVVSHTFKGSHNTKNRRLKSGLPTVTGRSCRLMPCFPTIPGHIFLFLSLDWLVCDARLAVRTVGYSTLIFRGFSIQEVRLEPKG